MRIPQALEAEWRRETDWLRALPKLAAECAEQWSLDLETPVPTPHSLVVPAGEVVLKLNAPSHFEADHEGDALQIWHGTGAVRLLGRDDARRALLVERCRPGTQLWHADVDEIAVVVPLLARLTRRLNDPAPFRLVADEAERWADEVPRRWQDAGRPFERDLLDFALDVYRSVDRRACFLVNQDLHGGNVLAARREPWLVIDPKPLVGEAEVNAVGLLRNAALRGQRLDRWLGALSEVGLDGERLRGWGVAHALAWGTDADGRWSAEQIAAARAIRDG